jgi:hypothetical protein
MTFASAMLALAAATGQAAAAETTSAAERQAYWALDGAADGQSPEYAGGNPLTLAGDASIYAATDDCAENPDCTPVTYPIVGSGDLLLDGDGDYAEAADPVVPSGAGFSVAAQVRLDADAATHDMTVLSQPGEHTSLFTLRYVAASKTWEAVVAHEDAVDAPTTTVSSSDTTSGLTSGVQALALVYDEDADQLRLYVDSYLADSESLGGADSWLSTRGLQVGRTVTAGAGSDYWAGEIDEVHTFAGVLTHDQLVFLRLGGVDV